MAKSGMGGGAGTSDTNDDDVTTTGDGSSNPHTETGSSTDGSGLYRPSPNPPFEPKPCQGCGSLVDGEETNGWWLEKECWQSPNRYELFCVSCCVDRLDVDTEDEVEKLLTS